MLDHGNGLADLPLQRRRLLGIPASELPPDSLGCLDKLLRQNRLRLLKDPGDGIGHQRPCQEGLRIAVGHKHSLGAQSADPRRLHPAGGEEHPHRRSGGNGTGGIKIIHRRLRSSTIRVSMHTRRRSAGIHATQHSPRSGAARFF